MSALSESEKSSTKSKLSGDDELLEKIWMVRPCEIYAQEYKECTSKQGREHQMYIYGRHMDCSKWEEDKNNCFKLRNQNNNEAAIEIIKHELTRRERRLAAARNNDVWEYRTGPPEDWNKPLTDWVKQRKNTTLSAAQEKLEKAGGDIDTLKTGSGCVIS